MSILYLILLTKSTIQISFGDVPADIMSYLKELDDFIEKEIKPLENSNDNIRFFDHRREWARTDFENGGLPRHEWEQLLGEVSPIGKG